MHAWKHFCTITKHRWAVRRGCFRVGLYWRGLVHDLSKYSPSEFITGAKYYQGTRSPNSRERELVGYSTAWMHHKGRNKHHYEYWTDLELKSRKYKPVEMPRKYFIEMIMDRIAACKTYHGKNYKNSDPLEYLLTSAEGRDTEMMHPQTKNDLTFVLTMLRDKGEKETFRFLRSVRKQDIPIQPSDTEDKI